MGGGKLSEVLISPLLLMSPQAFNMTIYFISILYNYVLLQFVFYMCHLFCASFFLLVAFFCINKISLLFNFPLFKSLLVL